MAAKSTRQSDRGLPSGYFSVGDLYLAYRNAKVDAFYERDLCIAYQFVEFEDDLHRNLKRVRDMLLKGSWIEDKDVLGKCSFIPKSLNFELVKENLDFDEAGQLAWKSVQTVPLKSWRERLKSERSRGREPVAKFRPVAASPVEWLVISALWIMKAGRKLDACLGHCARGSRLRRNKDGDFKYSAFGCFAPYAPAYNQWREDGLHAIRTELDRHRGCIAITADLRRFYHCVDPEFLKDERFVQRISDCEKDWNEENEDDPEQIRDEMSPIDWRFTAQIAESFKAWSLLNKNDLDVENPIGLPIGPGAARVVANLMLLAFDQFIEHEVQPLYYGRYVDDVFLVLRDGTGITTGKDVWNRIERLSMVSDASPCRVKIARESDEDAEKVCRLFLDYDTNPDGTVRSDLRFAGDKQKTFFIEGPGGEALLDAIEKQIRENSSEWRRLPELPSFDEDFREDFVVANPDITEPADNLRKADRLSIRRLKFALHLRDLEALAEDLDHKDGKQWSTARKRLYEFTETQLLAPQEYFVYASYIPRIFGLAVHAKDWQSARKLVRKISTLFKRLRLDCGARSNKTHLELCREDLGKKLRQALCQALPSDSEESIGSAKEYEKLIELVDKEFNQSLDKDYRKWASRLFARDLGRTPFRRDILNGSLHEQNEGTSEDEWPGDSYTLLGLSAMQRFLRGIDYQQVTVPMGMVFPTRPLSPGEIGLLDQTLLTVKNAEKLQEFVRAIRGAHFSELDDERQTQANSWFEDDEDGKNNFIWVPDAEFGKTVRISLPCITLSDDSWAASIARKKDPDLQRYTRITRLLNEVLQSQEKPNYIVLPELSLKSDWFNRFAAKLEKCGISLISGVEYAHSPYEGINTHEVVNSVRVSLVTRFPGYRTHLLYSQNKIRPAPQEKEGLMQIGGKTLSKGSSTRMLIRHGEFQFAILICSELTDIAARSELRGKIDALFVPEWNKDTDGFASLVEATALDLHCFIIQSNNRRYGDARIRAPLTNAWERDILRLKGGCVDFHATGEIDYIILRRFQSNHISPSKPFKPVPDGFKIHPSRSELPLII